MTEILLTTLIKRPYVVAFLISYLFIAGRTTGWRWTLQHLCSGYVIAFASEWLSINFGFPYGWYSYVYENLKGEWLNHGVPVWDSASYVFMSFAGLCAARMALRHNTLITKIGLLKLALLSAFLTTLLDVIVDPVAHLGEKWFLGRIYFYPEPGFYFDVTFANFIGWFITTFLINATGIFIWKFESLQKITVKENTFGINAVLALGLYYGIFAFGAGIAVYLQEWAILLCDFIWIALSIGIVGRGWRWHFPSLASS